MSLFIYRSKPSTGATDLAEAINGIRFRGRTKSIDKAVKTGDTVICWGETFTNPPTGVRVLNGGAVRSKFEDALKLREAGVETIEVSKTKPVAQPVPPPPDPAQEAYEKASQLAEDFAQLGDKAAQYGYRTQLFKQSVKDVIDRFSALNTAISVPAPVAPAVVQAEWIGRATNHVGGGDILRPTDWTVGYFAKKEEIVKEFRIHSFLGKSIRAGVKALRDGYVPAERVEQALHTTPDGRALYGHPWVRSWDGGWRIKYDGVSSKRKHRELAHAAVKALGLDFGAVDIGERADGSLLVLEVNRAPGLAEGTIDVYSKAINNWISGTNTPEV